jgi:hypothetical protein
MIARARLRGLRHLWHSAEDGRAARRGGACPAGRRLLRARLRDSPQAQRQARRPPALRRPGHHAQAPAPRVPPLAAAAHWGAHVAGPVPPDRGAGRVPVRIPAGALEPSGAGHCGRLGDREGSVRRGGVPQVQGTVCVLPWCARLAWRAVLACSLAPHTHMQWCFCKRMHSHFQPARARWRRCRVASGVRWSVCDRDLCFVTGRSTRSRSGSGSPSHVPRLRYLFVTCLPPPPPAGDKGAAGDDAQ